MTAVNELGALDQYRSDMVATGLPERVISIADRLGEAMLTFDADMGSAFDQVDETLETLDAQYPGEILGNLVEDGLISGGEAAAIFRLTKPILEMATIKTPNRANDKGPRRTVFEREIIEYTASRTGDATRADRRKANNPRAKEFIDLAKSIADRGEYLYPGKRLLDRLEQAGISAKPGRKVSKEDESELIGFENPEVLEVLNLIDVFTAVASLPDEAIAKQTRYGTDENRKRNLVTVTLVSALRAPVQYKKVIKYVLRHEPKTAFRRKLKGDNEQIQTAAFAVLDDYKVIGDYGSRQLRAEQQGLDELDQHIDDAYASVSDATDNITALLAQLEHEVDTYIGEDPTAHRVLGGLAVENWAEALLAVVDEDARHASRQPGQKPLHDAIESEVLGSQLEELRQVIEPLEHKVSEIEAKYIVNAQMIRDFNGGLDLRRLVELWREPGSNKALFSREQSQQLAGIGLRLRDNPKLKAQLANDFIELRQAWADLAFLQHGDRRSGLVRNLDTLAEWYESANAKQRNDVQLKPLWSLAELLISPDTAADDSDADADSKERGWRVPKEFEKIEFIEAFPPGSATTIADDLRMISKGWSGDPIEWERVDELVQLRAELIQSGFEVKTLRLMQTLWHPLPHYVIEATAPNGRVVAVVESPIYSNATYVVPGDNWREIVKSTKKTVSSKGWGLPKVHSATSTPYDHRQKLKNSVIENV